MQLDDSSIHKLFAIKTLRHTNMSSKLHIVIMKTIHNINHAIYAMHAAVLLWVLGPLRSITGLLLGYCMLYALCSVFEQEVFHYCIMLLNHALLNN